MIRSVPLQLFKHIGTKRFSIALGGLLTITGSAGQFLFVQSLADEIQREKDAIALNMHRIESLKNAQLGYFHTYQQSAMLFALDPSGVTRDKEVLANLYKLNLIDRTTVVRTMLSDLAYAGAVDFSTTYEKYTELVTKARDNFSWHTFSALSEAERKIVDAALAQQTKLEKQVLSQQSKKESVEHQLDNRRLTLVLISLLGSALLLIANMLTERKERLARDIEHHN